MGEDASGEALAGPSSAPLVRGDLARAKPVEVRQAVRSKRWTGATVGMARGHIQANLAILPHRYALDFLRFCLLNPKPCPLIEVLDAGDPRPRFCAAGADVRTDLSKYRIFRDGKVVEEVPDLLRHWRDDHVTFLLGCSLSFDQAMLDAGIPLHHLDGDSGRIPVYHSSIACKPAGMLRGNMMVSMRPIPRRLLMATIETTARHPIAHGSPVHVGDPADIGIVDLSQTYSNPAVPLQADEIPVFWGCGVTPQSVAMASGVPEMITHATGHMFLTDLTLASAKVLC
jgi:uncharacterized protein YcsI (UPF0317 family)